MKKLLIYGGQFNPIHIGHMLVASETYHFIKPNKFIFLPSYQSPLKNHKEAYVLEKERLNMLKLAIQDLGFGEIDERELKRKNISYTIDTVKALYDEYSDYQLYFVIGTDQYLKLDKWKQIDELKKMITFIVVNREVDKQEIEKSMLSINIPRIDISSTEIRQRCTHRRSIKMLVTPSIETYIKKGRLYES